MFDQATSGRARPSTNPAARPTPAGRTRVSTAALGDLDLDLRPLMVDGRPVTAFAPHPTDARLVYVTTGDPETLAFLPDPYFDLRP